MENKMEKKVAEAKPGKYLTFLLRGMSYGVPISSVREINRLTTITSVPRSAAYVAGVINLRGKVIPVVNLRQKFGEAAAASTNETCIVVVDGTEGQVGIIVDSVHSVVDLREDQIDATPNLGDRSKASFVIGMGKTEDKLVILLDILKILGESVLLPTEESMAA
jgi:purine-binding chemotaxis protein CheW